MRTRCPNCGAIASLDLLVSNTQAGQAFAAALEVPPQLKGLMLKYLGLFRPKTRELDFGRATTLLKDITPRINKGELSYNRVTTPAPIEAWQWGITEMLARRDKGGLKLPMSNHNYLYSIVQDYDPRIHGGEPIETFGSLVQAQEQTIMLNGIRKPVFANKTQQETFDIVMQAQDAGESADETYERIATQYQL